MNKNWKLKMFCEDSLKVNEIQIVDLYVYNYS